MKAGWEFKALDEVALVGAGNPAPQDKRHFEGGQFPFYRTSDVGQIRFGEISTSTDLLNAQGAKGLRLVPAGTVLIPKSGASTFLNHRVITCADGYVSSHLATVTARKGIAEPRFLLYALSQVKAQDLLADNSYPSLNLSLVGGITVPLPPLEEQQRIVAVLDETFEGLTRARAHAEANLQNARELFGSSLQHSFSSESEDWEEKSLAELGTVQTGSTPRTSEAGNEGDFIPFIKPGDFRPDGTLDYDNSGLSEKGASVSRLVPAGSALMVCIGATIGKAGFTDRTITTNQQINSIAPLKGVSGEYLYYQMLTPEFQASVIHRSGQATLPIINKSKWSSLKVRLPRRSKLQVEIVERLSKLRAHLDEASRLYNEKLKDIDALRQSLLQKAFAGELT